MGCEGCHGPGKEHADAGGDKTKIRSFSVALAAATPARPARAATSGPSTRSGRAASTTRATSAAPRATASTTPKGDKQLKAASETELCAQCHRAIVNKQLRFNHMPVREGKLVLLVVPQRARLGEREAAEGRRHGHRVLRQLPRREARALPVGARPGHRELLHLPRPARVEQRPDARGQAAVPVPALPRDLAASSDGVRRLPAEQLDQRQQDLRPLVRGLPSADPRVQRPVGQGVPAVGEENSDAQQTDDWHCGAPARLRHLRGGAGQAAGRRPPPRAGPSTSADASRPRTATRRATSATATCATASNANFFFSKETASWTFDIKAKNIGYRDGRYELNFNSQPGQVHGVLRPDADQLRATTPGRRTTARRAAARSMPACARRSQNGARWAFRRTSAQLPTGSIYNSIAQAVRSAVAPGHDRRRAAHLGHRQPRLHPRRQQLQAERATSRGARRSRSTSATELPLVIDNRETELEGRRSSGPATRACSTSATSTPSSTRTSRPSPSTTRSGRPTSAGSATRPVRRVPATTRAATSTATGPAFGRMAHAAVEHAGHGQLDGHGQAARPHDGERQPHAWAANHQDEALIPWTTNSGASHDPGGVRGVPGAGRAAARHGPDPRELHDRHGERELAARIKNLTLTARYRYNGRSDFTRPFDAVEYVRFDAVPEETGGIRPSRSTSTATRSTSTRRSPAIPYSTLRVGYGYDQLRARRARRPRAGKDNTARISYDFVGNQYVTLRAHVRAHQAADDQPQRGGPRGDGHAAGAPRFYDEAAASATGPRSSSSVTPAVRRRRQLLAVPPARTTTRARDPDAGVRPARQQEHRPGRWASTTRRTRR